MQRSANERSEPTYTDTVAGRLDHTAKPLETTLSIADTLFFGSAIPLKFVVRNPTDSLQRFCKWHTPFEPFLADYLIITDRDSTKVRYRGAMAKRMMPPPPEAYLEVAPRDSMSTTVDLTKAYAFDKPGTYHIVYQGQRISGLTVINDVTFALAER